MPILANARHEAFAQAIAANLTPRDAFRKVSGRIRSGDSVMGNKWLKLCEPRLKELRERADKVMEQATNREIERQAGKTAEAVARIVGAALTEAEMLAFLTNAVLTPIGQLDANNMLTHSIETTGSPGPDAKDLPINKLKAHDKLRAIELCAKLQGFLVEKVEQTVDDKRVKPPDERARLLRESIARRQGTHGAS